MTDNPADSQSGPDSTRFFDGRKFMWDGKVHGDAASAEAASADYAGRGFEVRRMPGGGGQLVYTRRVATAGSGQS